MTQAALLQVGVHLPDTYFTVTPDGGVLQWFGMQQHYQLVPAGSAEHTSAPVDEVIELPSYVGLEAVGGEGGGGGGDPNDNNNTRHYVLVPIPGAEAGADAAPDSPEGGRSWLQKVLQFKVKLGKYEWRPLWGVLGIRNTKLLAADISRAHNKLRVNIQRVNYPQFVRAILTQDAALDGDALDAFTGQFACVDELYAKSNCGAADGGGEGGGGGAAAE